jgi:hypothetical protein
LKSEYNIHIENEKRNKFSVSEETLTGGVDWIEEAGLKSLTLLSPTESWRRHYSAQVVILQKHKGNISDYKSAHR